VLVLSVLIAIGLVVGALTALGGRSSLSAPTLEPSGIGTVGFGLTKLKAVAELSDLFGAPSARGVNSGCGPRYTEVEWGDFAAEFRLNMFSGYRYMEGGYPFNMTTPREFPVKPGVPSLTTSKRITLGSTLAELRTASRVLRSYGTDTWRPEDGVVFVDDAKHDPIPPSSRIIEIKIGTCGDF
jgi:hypothetical protein